MPASCAGGGAAATTAPAATDTAGDVEDGEKELAGSGNSDSSRPGGGAAGCADVEGPAS